MNPFDLVLTRHPPGLVMTGVAPQGENTAAEENMGPVQYRRATFRRLRNAPTHIWLKLSAGRQRYKSDFDRKVSFHPVGNAGDFV